MLCVGTCTHLDPIGLLVHAWSANHELCASARRSGRVLGACAMIRVAVKSTPALPRIYWASTSRNSHPGRVMAARARPGAGVYAQC